MAFEESLGRSAEALPVAAGLERPTAAIWGNRHFSRAVLDSIETGVAILSADERIVSANGGFFRLLGYDKAELKGRLLVDLIVEASRGHVQAGEHRMRRKDGGELWVVLTLSEIPAEGLLPALTVVSIENRTSQKQAEARLATAQAEFRAMSEMQSELMFRATPEGRLTFLNDAFAAYFGGSPEDLRGRFLAELFAGEAHQFHDDFAALALGRLIPVRRVQAANASGELRWLEVHLERVPDTAGRLAEVRGAARDINDLVSMESVNALLSAAIENTAEGIFLTDQFGRIEYVNGAFGTMTGFHWEECVGRELHHFKSSERHSSGFFEELWATLAEGKTWKGRTMSRRKDGELFEADEMITPFRDQRTGSMHYVGVMRDVTKESALERQVRQAQKVEALGTLAGGIAHDFNNLLSIVLCYAQLAKEALLPDQTNVAQKLGEVLKAALRGRDLVQDLLNFSRKGDQPGQLKPVRVGLIAAEALRMLRPSLQESIRVQAQIDKAGCRVLGEATQIHQVVLNLCTNAIHAMRDHGGTLGVVVERLPLDEATAREFPELQSEEIVRLSVSDSGHGMDQRTLQRIFEPFFTTKQTGEGTGLGLAMVRGIVSRQGGVIQVETKPGKGTRFHVLWPLCKNEVTEESNQGVTATELSGNEHILFVDDEAPLADAGHYLLAQLGYRVTVETGPLEALELIQRQPDAFDLLICDQSMPDLTGLELAREARKVCPNLPIVLTSGYRSLLSPDRVQALGFAEVLPKPFDRESLAAAVRAALDQRDVSVDSAP